MKKIIAILLMLTLSLSILVGCFSFDNGGGGSIEDDGKYPADDGKYPAGDDGKYPADDGKYPAGDDGKNPTGGNNKDDGKYPAGDDVPKMTTVPDGMTGKDVASLILANQRLNSELLQNSSNIFEDGKETLLGLAEKATVSLAAQTVVRRSAYAAEELSGTSYECMDGSVVEIDGTTFRWSGFQEYSNSYDYFLNLTKGISTSAKQGARLIDEVKRYVRIVDKWVRVGGEGGEEYFLHVEENCEVLFSRRGDFLNVCKRTKEADGTNNYELFRTDGRFATRMVYSEGKKCEYSMIDGTFNHNFLAVNNKGFWEVVDVGVNEDHYNVSCMVIKNDICYDAFYNPREADRGISLIKAISSDRATDIITFLPYSEAAYITVNLQGFSGYEYIETVTTDDRIGTLTDETPGLEIVYGEYLNGHMMYLAHDSKNTVVVLNNGGKIKPEDIYASENVYVSSIRVNHFSKEPEDGSYIYGHGYTASIELRVMGSTFDEQMANLEAFFTETGLVCNRDFDGVKAGILRAYLELEQFTKYHQWNESPIYSEEDLARGWENNLAKHEAFETMYNEFKDASVIDFTDKVAMEIAISFSPIGSQIAASVTNSGVTVSIEDLKLTVTDTMLFVEGDDYSVYFALVGTGADKTLNHIPVEDPVGVTYRGGSTFEVSGTATFDISILAAGQYTLVAYVSTTDDGIRSSEYIPVSFTSIEEAEIDIGSTKIALSKNDKNELIVTFTENEDFGFTLEDGEYTSSTMYDALAAEIYNYGFVAEGAVLEMLSGEDTWSAVEDAESALASGTYRLKYNVQNGESLKEGYIFVNYEAPVVKE